MKRIMMGLVLTCLFSLAWSQRPYKGPQAEKFQKIAVSKLDDFYGMIIDAASEPDVQDIYVASINEHFLTEASVFRPDFTTKRNLTNVTSIENYLAELTTVYGTFLKRMSDNPEIFSIEIGKPAFLATEFTEDSYGIRISFKYPMTVKTEGDTIFTGTSQAIVVFPDITSPVNYRIVQIVPLDAGKEYVVQNPVNPIVNEYETVEEKETEVLIKTIGNDLAEMLNNIRPVTTTQPTLSELYGIYESWYRVGTTFYEGLNVEVDYKLAYEAFLKGSLLNDIQCIHMVGVCLEAGHGVEQNYDEAYLYYSRAAKEKYTPSIFRKGNILASGYGTRLDINTGIMLITKAAKKGHGAACYRLGEIYENGHCDQQRDEKKSLIWYVKGARTGHIPSAKRTVELYQAGKDIKVRKSEIERWMRMTGF